MVDEECNHHHQTECVRDVRWWGVALKGNKMDFSKMSGTLRRCTRTHIQSNVASFLVKSVFCWITVTTQVFQYPKI